MNTSIKFGIHWALTRRCNFNCLHCFNKSGHPNARQEYSLEEAERVISQLKEVGAGMVYLTGGEPLLYPHFDEVVERLEAAGIEVARIYTNGSLLTGEKLDFLAAHGMKPEIFISFDGIGTHALMRGVSDAEEKALKAIKLAKSRGHYVRVIMNLNPATLEKAPETGHMLAGLGVDSLFFVRTSETPEWQKQSIGSLSAKETCEAAAALSAALKAERKSGMSLKFFTLDEIGPEDTKESVEERHLRLERWERPYSGACRKTLQTPFLDVDGRILPCDGFDGVSAAAGFFTGENNNILKRSLAQILTDSDYSRFVNCSEMDLYEANPECRGCSHLNICRCTNCRAIGCLMAFVGGRSADEIVNAGRRANPLECMFYRDGYYERLLETLK